MTKKQAKEIIEKYGKDTAYYGENNRDFLTNEKCVTYDSMFDMFRYRFGMGEAESICIIAALRLSGAEFEGELTRV